MSLLPNTIFKVKGQLSHIKQTATKCHTITAVTCQTENCHMSNTRLYIVKLTVVTRPTNRCQILKRNVQQTATKCHTVTGVTCYTMTAVTFQTDDFTMSNIRLSHVKLSHIQLAAVKSYKPTCSTIHRLLPNVIL